MTRHTHTPQQSSSSTKLHDGLNSPGFTVVEVIVVIVVIAILAAVGWVGYGAYLDRTGEVVIKSDLKNGAAALESSRIHDNGYPESADGADRGRGLPRSDGTTLAYYKTAAAYCLEATFDRPSVPQFHIAGRNPEKILDGPCVMRVSVLAGGGGRGFADGDGASARFDRPHGVAVDRVGNVYVADEVNSSIRKITPSGSTSTLAGNGVRGFADGLGTGAQFRNPHSVAVDDDGFVYVADRDNHRIRKISPVGEVTTLAGSATSGLSDGIGTAARFASPSGIAVGTDGVVYVADTDNNAIRRITPSGLVSTLAGSGVAGFTDGSGAAARFRKPWSVAVSAAGTLFVADSDNYSVRQITPAGAVTTVAGNGTSGFADGKGRSARFGAVHGIALNATGELYVADVSNGRVRRVTNSGVVTTAAGSGVLGNETGDPSETQFRYPHGVAVAPTGALYVADTDGNRIARLEPSDDL